MIVVVLLIVSAIVAYVANYNIAIRAIKRKEHLLHLLRENITFSETGDWKVPHGHLCLRFDDEGKVINQKNMDILQDANIHKTPLKDLFEKLRGRALTGGGFTKFKWVDPNSQTLKEYLFSSMRHGPNTTCIASEI